MKRLLFAIILVLFASSCSKKDSTTLTLLTKSQEKTNLDGLNVVWTEGDEINVNGSNYVIHIDNGVATVEVDISLDGEYYAYYPAQCVQSYNNSTHEFSVNIPNTHSYSADYIQIPLSGHSNGGPLMMNNIISLLKFRITDSNSNHISINNINIVASTTLSGSGNVIDNIFTLTQASSSALSITNCDNIDHLYYIPVIPIQAGNAIIVIVNGSKTELVYGIEIEESFSKRVVVPINSDIIAGHAYGINIEI